MRFVCFKLFKMPPYIDGGMIDSKKRTHKWLEKPKSVGKIKT